MKAHRCILMGRSEKFRIMLSHNMIETTSHLISIKNENITPEIFKCMLKWMYTSEIELPTEVFDVVKLLQLTDEYLLSDL